MDRIAESLNMSKKKVRNAIEGKHYLCKCVDHFGCKVQKQGGCLFYVDFFWLAFDHWQVLSICGSKFMPPNGSNFSDYECKIKVHLLCTI
ncbi:hypothetical protein ABKV19_017480 [Rosa sericea]